MVLFMGFGVHFEAFTLHFSANCTAFWRIFHCVLVQNALRFGAYCTAFWCKMRCNNQRLEFIFLTLRMQILGIFSSKRNAKT